jgi:iron(III) transport system substrate-binding protein
MRASLIFAALIALCCGPVLAQAPSASAPAPDEKVIAAAKKEGVVSIYTSANVEDMGLLSAAFEKKYGVKLRTWRASSEQVLQRGVVEARGGRYDADLFETGGGAMEALHREKLLQPMNPPAGSDLDPAALTAHREWTGTRYNIFFAAYNTRLIRKDELPKSYDDLLASKWKGKLGIETDDSDWFGTVIGKLGEERGLKLFRDIVATNGVSVRKGHTLLANLVVSGEVPLALTTYAYRVAQLHDSGAPIDWFAIPPVIARFEGVGVARRPPHPNAAALYFDFLLTDAQALLRDRDYYPAARNVRPLPEGVTVSFLDPAKSLDENQKWTKYYRDTVITQAR